ncbi:hypothetical protein PBI_KESHU_56 [Mycobacterium phage Keshu]|uniref:Uncharacterized protein n=1 Tax=Mycobacterium phage Keshu TaxID=1567471 RepID=A0A0B5A5D9_9CAUD|nr:hypothetical protein PBI_KESHU_56 [Mycobacterium phage Keshu]AJD82276.1 hypothetical protein PBI_KESHU_56 [Mycobacterium phage Keshu]
MSESTSGVQCHVCGLYDARVFDPSGAMWCRVCDILGLGSMAVAEKVAEIADGVGKAFDAATLYGEVTSATEAGDPEAWLPSLLGAVGKFAEERFVPDYAAVNARWREQMGEAAAHIPTAAESLAAYEGPLVDEIAGRTARIGEALVAGVDEINAQLRAGADDGVRSDLMGKLGALLAESDVSIEARTWVPDDAEVPSPGALYTIPEPPQVHPTVRVPGIVDSFDQAHKAFVWEDAEGAHWGWTVGNGWVAWNTAPYRVGLGAVGPFRPAFLRPDVDLFAPSNQAGEPSTSENAEAGKPENLLDGLNIDDLDLGDAPRAVTDRQPGDTCCGGGNPGGHEWNCGVLKAANYGPPEWITRLQADTIAELIEETVVPVGDAVAHPSHYTSSPAACSGCGKPIECIDVTQHMGFNLGNTTKYVWRCDLKRDAIEDLRKARQYLDFEIEKRERALVDDFKSGKDRAK